jgi:DNA-binding LytR/AlgR family response regulator
MDIDIEGSMDGVQLSKIILSKEIKSTVIFLTSNDDDHSFELAMESKPFDFLSKPVSPRRLKRTIQLALQSKSQKESSKEDWTIKDGRVLHRIKISDIGFVESQDKYCMFHFENGQKELIRITLNEVIRNLNPEMFFQVHRSFLVNLSLVSKFDVSSSEIYLTHQNRIPVSRKFKEELIHRLR